MNRTTTAPQVLELLAEWATIRQVAEALNLPRTTIEAAVNRLKAKGKLDRRVDDLGYVQWKAKEAARIPENKPAA